MSDTENAVVIGYMCKVDFDIELGENPQGNLVFPTLEDVREHRPCARQDGIVEVEVRLRRIVQDENFGSGDNDPQAKDRQQFT